MNPASAMWPNPREAPDLNFRYPVHNNVTPPDDIDNDDDYNKKNRRTVFSRKQLLALEQRFMEQTFLSKEERKELADDLELTERQIMVWFQNRRGRLKRRGPADTAYTEDKLKELHNRRPYPFLYGLLSSAHTSKVHSHPYQHLISASTNTVDLPSPNVVVTDIPANPSISGAQPMTQHMEKFAGDAHYQNNNSNVPLQSRYGGETPHTSGHGGAFLNGGALMKTPSPPMGYHHGHTQTMNQVSLPWPQNQNHTTAEQQQLSPDSHGKVSPPYFRMGSAMYTDRMNHPAQHPSLHPAQHPPHHQPHHPAQHPAQHTPPNAIRRQPALSHSTRDMSTPFSGYSNCAEQNPYHLQSSPPEAKHNVQGQTQMATPRTGFQNHNSCVSQTFGLSPEQQGYSTETNDSPESGEYPGLNINVIPNMDDIPDISLSLSKYQNSMKTKPNPSVCWTNKSNACA